MAREPDVCRCVGRISRNRRLCKCKAAYATLIEAYEEEHHAIPDASPVEVLRTLMDGNGLRQKDLVPIFGSESIVSEIWHKKRDLDKTHIEKLSKRLHISPATFF